MASNDPERQIRPTFSDYVTAHFKIKQLIFDQLHLISACNDWIKKLWNTISETLPKNCFGSSNTYVSYYHVEYLNLS